MTEAVKWLREQGIEPKPFRIGDYKAGDLSLEKWKIRDKFIAKFGFAIMSDEAGEIIARYAPILEVGAGCGYWSYELRKAGVDVVATEPHPGMKYGAIPEAWKPWIELDPITGTDAVAKYPGRSLLVGWPSLNDPWPSDTLKAFNNPGSIVIYVGEGDGGCTADDNFHNQLRDDFELIMDVAIPQFVGIHDDLTVWQRKQRRAITL
jgi:hypothetical protein